MRLEHRATLDRGATTPLVMNPAPFRATPSQGWIANARPHDRFRGLRRSPSTFRHPEELPDDRQPDLVRTGSAQDIRGGSGPGPRPAGADLDVVKGEFIAIMGPSGCGKSTLLNLVAGLDVADEGEIVLGGQTITGRDEDWLARMRRRDIGMVFQFFNLLEGMTVLENVALPAIIAGKRRKAAESAGRRSPGPAGPCRQGERGSGGPLRRSAPAAGHRPGFGEPADPAAGRRADGQVGYSTEAERSSNSSAGCTPTARPLAGHPQHRGGGRRREGAVHMRDGRIEDEGRCRVIRLTRGPLWVTR